MFKYRNLYKMLGYKRVFIAGNVVIIKRLTPQDFIEEPNGVPITLFQYQKGRTLADQLRGDADKEEENYSEIVGLAKQIAKKAVVYFPDKLSIDDLFGGDVATVKLGWELYGAIIAHNFKGLFKTYQMDQIYLVHVGELCVAFGKKPHEHLCNPKQLTELEKYIIDDFVFNAYIQNENEKAKRLANGG